MESKKSRSNKSPRTSESYYVEEEEEKRTRTIKFSMVLIGVATPPPMECQLIVMFDDSTIFTSKWIDEANLDFDLSIDLLDPYYQAVVADIPLILLVRVIGGKGKSAKDADALMHGDNRAGGTVDLMPLVLGENSVNVNVRLVKPTGELFGCEVEVYATAVGPDIEQNLVPLYLTMVSGHCFPPTKEGTVYISALGLDGLIEGVSLHFNKSLSYPEANKLVWATACTGGHFVNTEYYTPYDDMYIPGGLLVETNERCTSVYWNSIRRVLVDPIILRERIERPFSIEVAGVPRQGKIDVRGRYMGLVDAKVLLQPNQTTLMTCIKLSLFVEADLPEGVGPLLELPVSSAKSSARSPLVCADIQGHTPFVVLKLDLGEPLIPKQKILTHFDIIGFPPPETRVPLNELYIEPPPEDPSVDVRKIRAECGALAVHKELSKLACRGAVPMNQGIKKTAANKLLTRVRTMIKQFSPGECSYIEWQDTVTAQHAASRRAVTASLRPQPPPKRVSAPPVAARARMAGDTRIYLKRVDYNLEAYDKHPRVILSKALRCLEARHDYEAMDYLVRAISSQPRNRQLLWLYGGLKFDKGSESLEVAKAAFLIAVKGDYSDGIACTIGWAALHTLYHFEGNPYGAFTSAKKMRKAHELKREWKEFNKRWIDTSGEEEVYWVPRIISTDNPLVMAAAFFLCLRCYKFTEKLLRCAEYECATRGSRLGLKTKITKDVYYIRAASLLLRRQVDDALQLTEEGVRRFGPSAMLSQMRATCLVVDRDWDDNCAAALGEAERAGADICSAILLQAALKEMKTNPDGALQRAGRAHEQTPCAHSALAIARIYGRRGELILAEKWAAGAVRQEPWLADGWAVLALLAMGDRDGEKARTMLRTARQVGPISDDIERQIKKVMRIVKVEALPDSLVKNVCFCDYLPTID